MRWRVRGRSGQEPTSPTPELDTLADLWAQAELKFPPTGGWGMKLFRRWLFPPHDGSVWGLSFSNTDGRSVSSDDVSPSACFRQLLQPDSEETIRDADIAEAKEWLAEAEEEAQRRRDRLEAVLKKPRA